MLQCGWRVEIDDFDLTAIGPAGVDLGFIVLMLFRCGFAAHLVLGIANFARHIAGAEHNR